MPFHCGSEIRPLTDAAQTLRIDNFAELRQFSAITLIVSDPIEKWPTITLGKIRSDPDVLFTTNAEDVGNRLNIVVDR